MKQKNKLYSQNKIAEILGISRGTFSKWLKENGVSPKQLEGQKKLYGETVIEQYKKSKKERNGNSFKRLTTVELLQNSLDEKNREINYLREQLEDKEKQLEDKDKVIADFGSRFATLADQAQKLNLADKKQPQIEDSSDKDTVSVARETETVKKGFWKKLFDK